MESKHKTEKQRFSIVRRAKSFAHAGRGISIFLKTTHNAWIHIFVFVCVILMGFYFKISHVEWLSLILAGGLVLTAEAINTAIEIDIDLTSPEFHPYARGTKDVAAGAVLIASCVAVVVGLIIFAPYLLPFIK